MPRTPAASWRPTSVPPSASSHRGTEHSPSASSPGSAWAGRRRIADPVAGYHLDRFLDAQEDIHDQAIAELRAGTKRSHWMWFVFPQLEGLGVSATSRRYAIRSANEARAYLRHPVLGARLTECTEVVN